MDAPATQVEVELNGRWYSRRAGAPTKVCGEWNAYKGHPHHQFQLHSEWIRHGDGEPLTLPPGQYKARIRLVVSGRDSGKFITSKLLRFRVAGDR